MMCSEGFNCISKHHVTVQAEERGPQPTSPSRKELCKYYYKNTRNARSTMHKELPCKFYLRYKSCRFGAKCRFSHVRSDKAENAFYYVEAPTARKSLLGDFPGQSVFNNEANLQNTSHLGMIPPLPVQQEGVYKVPLTHVYHPNRSAIEVEEFVPPVTSYVSQQQQSTIKTEEVSQIDEQILPTISISSEVLPNTEIPEITMTCTVTGESYNVVNYNSCISNLIPNVMQQINMFMRSSLDSTPNSRGQLQDSTVDSQMKECIEIDASLKSHPEIPYKLVPITF